MIDAKDLRLGNLVIWNPKLLNPQITLLPMLVEIAVVAQDKIGYTPYKLGQRVEPFEDDRMVQMETIYKPIGEFEPVVLNIEIIEKIGFENINGIYQLKGFYPRLILKEDIWNVDLVPSKILIGIKYLHQLQNLYYAVLNDELEIDL
jgi:hypothetical protein